MAQCGDTYTVAGTTENALYFWGTRHYGEVNFLPFTNARSKSKHSKDGIEKRTSKSDFSEAEMDIIQIGNNFEVNKHLAWLSRLNWLTG